MFQVGLDVVGCVPVIGIVANVANVGIFVGRGDWLGAGLSVASCIPGAGPFLKGGKWAKGIVNATSKFAKGVTASKAMNVVQKARNIAQHAFQFVLDKIKSVKGKVFSGSRSGTSSKDLQEMLGKLSDRMQAVLGGQGSLGRKLATDFAVGSTRLMVEDYLYENYRIDLPFFPLNRKAFSTKLGARSGGGTSRGSGQTPKKQGQGSKKDNKGIGKDGLTNDRRKEYKEKIKKLEAQGKQKEADNVRYDRYTEGKQNQGKPAKPREEWNKDLERVRENRQRGAEAEKNGRQALNNHLGDQGTLINNNEGKIVTHTSRVEQVTTRPDSIGYKDGKINVVHDHKHFTGKGDQVLSNNKQMRAQREMAGEEARHIVTISSDNVALNAKPPRPRPSRTFNDKSEIFYTPPGSSEITHKWVQNKKSKIWSWKKIKN